jgi:hypothetical protein
MSMIYEPEFKPRFLPRHCVKIDGRFFEVVSVQPGFSWDYKRVNIVSEFDLDLKEQGLKGLKDELLNIRLRVYGPVQLILRVEGAGGPVFGGYAATEKYADERTPPNLLEFFIFGDSRGWLYARVKPLTTPAWVKIRAEGYIYKVRELEKPPAQYTPIPYISEPR